jgi:hypothetical protein
MVRSPYSSTPVLIPVRIHSYSFVACVGTTPTYYKYASVAILLVASLYF